MLPAFLPRPACLALLCLGLWTPVASAQLYKWVDENGRTHYSDKAKPETGAQLVELPEETPPVISITPEPPDDTLATRQALMRPPGRHLPPFVVTVQPLGETRQEVGSLRAGELCRKIRPLYWPDIRQERAWLLPTPDRLASAASQSLLEFDYEAVGTTLDTALARQRQTGGILLQLQVAQLHLEACAPDIQAGTRAYEPDAMSTLVFRRHRFQLAADWTLLASDGRTLFTGRTSTDAGSLQHDDNSNAVLRATLDKAVMQLLADPAFQAALETTARPAAVALPALPATEPGRQGWSLADLLPGHWQRRANLAAILASLAPVKVAMTEFYLTEGEWPRTFAQMSLEVAPTVHGATVLIQPGGLVVARLPEQFGTGKELRLQAPPDPAVIGATWTCETNIDERPDTCTGF